MTMDQLKRRGFPLANMCPLYSSDEEIIEHLFSSLNCGLGAVDFTLSSYGCCLSVSLLD